MVRRERFANDAETTLNGAINDVVTSLTVTSATEFPTEGDFRLLIDLEIVLVTAVAGAVFTIVRAQEGTTGASHTDLAPVIQIVTEDGLQSYLRESVDPWFNERPPYRIHNASGNKLTKSDFTQVNFTNTTAVDNLGGFISIENDDAPLGAHSLRVLVRTAPSTPYTIEGCVDMGIGALHIPTSGSGHFGLLFRETSSSKIVSISFRPNDVYAVWNWTNATTFASAATSGDSFSHFDRVWMKISADGTNLTYDISHDGINYVQLFTSVKGLFFTTAPDQVGFYYSANNAMLNNRANLLAWSE